MKNYLLNHDVITPMLAKDKIVLVDGGARGELFPPFSLLKNEIVRVFRFDPDPGAKIVDSTTDEVIIQKALWKSRGTIDINIAENPSTSSVYPFNTQLQSYIDPYADVRKTKEVVTVDSISLDELVREYENTKIDFIKLDIHGAEYEVLKGATQVLNTNLGMLIESWVLPVHRGQKLRADVERLAYDHKFYVFEEFHIANWARLNSRFSKRQPVALDTLYFKDPMLDDNITDEVDAIKLIGLANLFEHNAFALQLATNLHRKKILGAQLFQFISNHIESHSQTGLMQRVGRKVRKVLRWLR